MTKSEICRRLSETLEARPYFDKPPYPDIGELLTSNEGFWTFRNIDGEDRQPVNYFESEDASARLLDWMRNARMSRQDYLILRTLMLQIVADPTLDRKTAIVLAACRWKQIEVGEMEEGNGL